jgi:hypothetical protein
VGKFFAPVAAEAGRTVGLATTAGMWDWGSPHAGVRVNSIKLPLLQIYKIVPFYVFGT